MTKTIAIVDYGMGNLRSVHNAFVHLGCKPRIASRPEDLGGADLYVLPGVGAFAEAMHRLASSGMDQALERQVIGGKRPLLGICLGMQLLAEHSEEGDADGLGWVPGEVRKIRPVGGLRIPNIGWHELHPTRKDPIFQNLEDQMSFYFVHSYAFYCGREDVLATFNYGEEVPAALRHENIVGTQFHPEMSSTSGLTLLRNLIAGLA